MTEAELIYAAKQGDENAFKKLIRQYESQVAATVIGMLGHGPEAEDIGQDTFIRFYKGLKQFRGDARVGTYLTRIAINLSLNAIKRRKRKRLLFWEQHEDNHKQVPHHSPEFYNGDKEIIQKSLQTLSPEFRSVIVLRVMDGYSTRETAEILKIPEGTVLSRLARAQQKLKTILSPYFGEYHERANTRSAASIA